MTMELVLIAIGGIFLIFLLLLPFMVLLHELGHAIPLMLMTKRGAMIYVGSYGDEQYSFCIKIGFLTIWLRYNPRHWRGGLCVPAQANLPTWQRIIYLAGGPLCSLLVSTLAFYFAFAYDMHGLLKEVSVIAALLGIADAALNLTPRVITTRTGKRLYSDGYKLLNVRKTNDLMEKFNRGNELFIKKEYENARVIYEDVMSKGAKNEAVYKMLNQCYLNLKEYEKAFRLQKEIEQQFTLTANDLYNMGLTCLFLKKEERLAYFEKALVLEPNHALTLNAMGYDLNTRERFAEALPLLNRAIEGMPTSAHAYANRGHAKIALGDAEAGLQDIDHSLTLDDQIAHAYRNKAIYYLTKGDKVTAMSFLLTAKEIDASTEMVDELMEQAR